MRRRVQPLWSVRGASKPPVARRRSSSPQLDAESFTARESRPLGRRCGLGARSTLRFQQQACHLMQPLAAARSTLRTRLPHSSWLGGGMSGP